MTIATLPAAEDRRRRTRLRRPPGPQGHRATSPVSSPVQPLSGMRCISRPRPSTPPPRSPAAGASRSALTVDVLLAGLARRGGALRAAAPGQRRRLARPGAPRQAVPRRRARPGPPPGPPRAALTASRPRRGTAPCRDRATAPRRPRRVLRPAARSSGWPARAPPSPGSARAAGRPGTCRGPAPALVDRRCWVAYGVGAVAVWPTAAAASRPWSRCGAARRVAPGEARPRRVGGRCPSRSACWPCSPARSGRPTTPTTRPTAASSPLGGDPYLTRAERLGRRADPVHQPGRAAVDRHVERLRPVRHAAAGADLAPRRRRTCARPSGSGSCSSCVAWLGGAAAAAARRRRPRGRVDILWTLNPLVFGVGVLGAHVDLVAAALARGRPGRWRPAARSLAGAVVGLAVSCQGHLRRRRRRRSSSAWWVTERAAASAARAGPLVLAAPRRRRAAAPVGRPARLRPARPRPPVDLARDPVAAALRGAQRPARVRAPRASLGHRGCRRRRGRWLLRRACLARLDPWPRARRPPTGAGGALGRWCLSAAYALAAPYSLPWYDLLAWASCRRAGRRRRRPRPAGCASWRWRSPTCPGAWSA